MADKTITEIPDSKRIKLRQGHEVSLSTNELGVACLLAHLREQSGNTLKVIKWSFWNILKSGAKKTANPNTAAAKTKII